MKIITTLLAVALVAVFASSAEARKDRRPYSGFKTGYCKTSSCYSKHPGGRYVYPNHYSRKKRW